MLKKEKRLLVNGVITKAVIIDYDYSLRSSSSYVYNFCIKNKKVYGKLTMKNEIHGWFIYGDIITIVYDPKNPKINEPIFQLYKKKQSVLNNYEHEFPKNFKTHPELYKGRQQGLDSYNWVVIKEKYPIKREDFPCLPPEYYGEF